MFQVRQGVFETNSSSVHSITMCTKEEYQKWENGELLHLKYDGKFISLDDKDKYDSYEIQTYNQYCDNHYLEGYYEEYVTPGGETVVAFGEYGQDY